MKAFPIIFIQSSKINFSVPLYYGKIGRKIFHAKTLHVSPQTKIEKVTIEQLIFLSLSGEGTSDWKGNLTSCRENSFQCEAKLVIENFRFSVVHDKYVAVKRAHFVRHRIEWSLQS
jgi:hypothetical protein